MKEGGNNELRKKIQDYSYGLTDKIGKGENSNVFRGINEKTKEEVAIKVINLKSIKSRAAKARLESEIEVLKNLNHPNIVKCYDIYSTVNNCYIITQFCNEGDLEHLLSKRQKLSQPEAIPIFKDIVCGFKAMIEYNFMHRDIQPQNILIKDKVAKIADFGNGKKIDRDSREDNSLGNPRYSSPQTLEFNVYGIQSEIWSLGILLYELLHGRIPWEESEVVLQKNTNEIVFSNNLSEDAKDFMKKCLQRDISKRLDYEEFNHHPFIIRIIEHLHFPVLHAKLSSAQQVSPQSKRELTDHRLLEVGVEVEVEAKSLHHRKSPQQRRKSEAQLISQLNFMRFIFRYIQILNFCKYEESSNILKLMASKQMFSQLYSLQRALEGENLFSFQEWDSFLQVPDKVKSYKQVLSDYEVRYNRILKSYSDWISKVRRCPFSTFLNLNFTRSEALAISIVKICKNQCAKLWENLLILNSMGESEEGRKIFSQEAIRLDFTITYYQLNCLLIEGFHDCDYFTRSSKIEVIVENKPSNLNSESMKELEQKLVLLEIIR